MSFIKDFAEDLLGTTAGRAARRSGDVQAEAGEQAIGTITDAAARAQGFLSPFGAVGQQGLSQAGFLGDPQAQFDFLQNNPLFQLALENANQGTLASAAAGGRLSAGDTLQQLSNNVLLSASPLIDRQRQDIFGQLGFGAGLAGQQAGIEQGLGANIANLQTGIGAAQAGGIVGQATARGERAQNIARLAGNVGSFFFSDPKLKKKINLIGQKNGYNIWEWEWNKKAFENFGLKGRSEGVMLTEVLEKNPRAVIYQDGFGKVNYGMIGISQETH